MSKKVFPEAKALSDVAQFHDTFRLPIESKPLIPSPDRCALRINLLEEELKELKEAINEGDLTEIVDALCDIQYVLSGAILEFGCGHIFKEMFEEVQRSNMSKTCATLEEAAATQKHYKEKDGTDSHIVRSGEAYLVYRTEDGKVLKSVNYSPARLKEILTRHL